MDSPVRTSFRVIRRSDLPSISCWVGRGGFRRRGLLAGVARRVSAGIDGYREQERRRFLPDPGKQWLAPRTLSLWSSWRHLWLPSWPGLAADRSPRGCGCQQTVDVTLKHPPLWNSCAMCRTDMTQYLLTSTEPFALSSMLAVREDVNSINHSSVRKMRIPFLIPAGEKCMLQQVREDGLNKTLHLSLHISAPGLMYHHVHSCWLLKSLTATWYSALS